VCLRLVQVSSQISVAIVDGFAVGNDIVETGADSYGLARTKARRLGLDALLAGVDTPSLRMVAGLGRN
jgi:hypothetical protein